MKCKDCKWLDRTRCKRYPPVALFSPSSRDDRGIVHGGLLLKKYPEMDDEDFCGEFKDKKHKPGPGSHA